MHLCVALFVLLGSVVTRIVCKSNECSVLLIGGVTKLQFEERRSYLRVERVVPNEFRENSLLKGCVHQFCRNKYDIRRNNSSTAQLEETHYSAVDLSTKIWLIPSASENSRSSYLRTEDDKATLEEGPALIHHRKHTGVSEFGSEQAVVCGGIGFDGQQLSDCEILMRNGSLFQAPFHLQQRRAWFTLTRFADGALMAVGGFWENERNERNVLGDAEIIGSDTARLAPLATPRMAHAAVKLDETRLLVCGGSTHSEDLRDCEMYDRTEDRWLPALQMKQRRSGLSLALIGDSVYAFGGLPLDSLYSIEVLKHDEWRLHSNVLKNAGHNFGLINLCRPDMGVSSPLRNQTSRSTVSGLLVSLVENGTSESIFATHPLSFISSPQQAPVISVRRLDAFVRLNSSVALWISKKSTYFIRNNGDITKGPELTQPREFSAATLLKIGNETVPVVCGGQYPNGTGLKTCEMIKGNTTEMLPGEMTFGRAYFSLTAFGSTLIAVGGRRHCCETGYSFYEPLRHIEMYKDGTWTLVGTTSTPRIDHAAVKIDDRTMLICGGAWEVSSCELYDHVSNTVVEGPELNVPRMGARMTVIDKLVYIMGGSKRSSIEVLDLARGMQNAQWHIYYNVLKRVEMRFGIW